MSNMQVTVSVGLLQFVMATAVCAQPAPAPRDRDAEALLSAQRQVLRILRAGEPGERTEQRARELIEQQVARGRPREAFTPEAVERAVMEDITQQLQRGAGITTVTAARLLYKMTPEDFYRFFKPRTVDTARVFAAYLENHDRKLLRELRSEPLDPDSVRTIIAATEKAGPAALPACAEVLAHDWSLEGKAYLYGKLKPGVDSESARRILHAFAQREQVDAGALAAFAEGTTDDALLKAAFYVAELSLPVDPPPKSFC